MLENSETLIHLVVRLIEWLGVAIIAAGALVTLALYVARMGRGVEPMTAFRSFRRSLGRAILLGLEFLVAADIVHTVAIEPTLDSLAVLAGIVLIRTFLSFSLEVELEGRWPWQREQTRR